MQRIPLDFLEGDAFKEAVSLYVRPFLKKVGFCPMIYLLLILELSVHEKLLRVHGDSSDLNEWFLSFYFMLAAKFYADVYFQGVPSLFTDLRPPL